MQMRLSAKEEEVGRLSHTWRDATRTHSTRGPVPRKRMLGLGLQEGM